MVAAEPQLLFALIVVFLMFLLFVRRKRAMLLLIPVPAAFAVAPTLVNAVRYADLGMWRQLFGAHHGANVIRQRVAGVAESA